MWLVIGLVIVFVIGFYAGCTFNDIAEDAEDGILGFYEGESVDDIYRQLSPEEQKDFLSQCASLMARNRKRKQKDATDSNNFGATVGLDYDDGRCSGKGCNSTCGTECIQRSEESALIGADSRSGSDPKSDRE